MKVQQVALLVVICVSMSHSAIIKKSPQKDLLDYESRLSILLRFLKADCGVSTNLSELITDDLDLLKIRYQRTVHQLSDCHKEKAKGTFAAATECTNGYKLNPSSKTCIRLIKQQKSWDDAKNYCEANGEYLATFESLESANWFINQRLTDPVWRTSTSIWFGGRKTANGPWRWYGKSTGLVNYVIWDKGEPNNPANENCMANHLGPENGYDGKTHNGACGVASHFVCERLV